MKTASFYLSLQIVKFRTEAEKKVVYAKNFRKRHRDAFVTDQEARAARQ